MKLSEQQGAFLRDVAALIEFASNQGYIVTGDELKRSQVSAWLNSLPPKCVLVAHTSDNKEIHFWETVGGAGIKNSLHMEALAIDLNMILNGVLISDVNTLKPLGDFWQARNPLNRWGGYFTHQDSDHYERQPE